VFMGQGEPLLNLENVLHSLEIFNNNFQIGARRITISTSGIVPKINELAQMDLQWTLAISLHAPNHTKRSQIMEIENKYSMDELKKALLRYVDKTGRRITIEYLLIKDFNDSIEDAKALVAYICDIKCNVNLIPYNPIFGVKHDKPSNNAIMRFKSLVEYSGKKVTVRLERGADIDAACGQLKGNLP
jgi:23S rRNA (adenine2503-C2)-methyltransferase